MAIAFARVSIHSRSKGHSAIAASAYRSGSKLFDSRMGLTHDFSNRRDVVYATLLLPEGCDDAFTNREFLWNQAELAEKRRDAQICKDVVLALPKELDLIHQIELTQRFAKEHFIENGLPADIAIHDHDDGNPHAHILIPTRRLEKNRFSKYKARDLNPAFAKGHVVENDYWGERWREMQNDYFAEKNIDLNVDINHIISERHQGTIQGSAKHHLLDDNKMIRETRLELARSSTENTIKHLSSQHSVFTRRDVEKLLFKTFKENQNANEYLTLIEQVLSNKNVICLGSNDKGKESYTTRQQYIQEARLRNDIEKMMQRKNHVYTKGADNLAVQYTLNDEQHEALNYITKGPDISVVVGRPGTGKSYLLKPVKDYYETNHCHVIGASLSGKVAKAMQTETGIESSTIASLTYRLKHNKLRLTNKHVLVVDEAGMVDFNNMSLLIHKAKKAGSKILLVGDPDQLKPIHKGEIFKGIAGITGYIELENIRRQEDLGDRQASHNLAKGNINEAIQHYFNKGTVVLRETTMDATDQLIDDWQKDFTNKTLKDSVLLSFTRAAVAELNAKARDALKDKKIIGHEEVDFQGAEKQLKISTGERLLFRQNNKDIGVRNGDLGTVRAIHTDQLQVELDSGEILKIPKTYKSIDYGYALTVHKSQGMTVKHAKVLIDSKYWDRHLSFVAMTRHKQSLTIYADSINHPTLSDLKRTLARSTTRDNVIDWPLDFAIRSGFNPDNLVGKVVNHLAGIGNKIKERFDFVVNYESYLSSQPKSLHLDKYNLHHVAKEYAKKRDEQHQTSIFTTIKSENPLFAKYDSMLKQRQHQTGYFREKLDKEIQEIAKKLLKDKNITTKITQISPQMIKQMQIFVQSHIKKDLTLE